MTDPSDNDRLSCHFGVLEKSTLSPNYESGQGRKHLLKDPPDQSGWQRHLQRVIKGSPCATANQMEGVWQPISSWAEWGARIQLLEEGKRNFFSNTWALITAVIIIIIKLWANACFSSGRHVFDIKPTIHLPVIFQNSDIPEFSFQSHTRTNEPFFWNEKLTWTSV